MANVHDVAEFILRESGAMTAMKLHKLVYYGEAWSLVLLGRPLFPEQIRAWTYGPVVRELFLRHRGSFVVSTVGGDADQLASDERRVLRGVLQTYGVLDGVQLTEATHGEPPWSVTRDAIRRGENGARVISESAMVEYFSGLAPPFVSTS